MASYTRTVLAPGDDTKDRPNDGRALIDTLGIQETTLGDRALLDASLRTLNAPRRFESGRLNALLRGRQPAGVNLSVGEGFNFG
jgi:hypothetical protein